jgi:hypothetical protein
MPSVCHYADEFKPVAALLPVCGGMMLEVVRAMARVTLLFESISCLTPLLPPARGRELNFSMVQGFTSPTGVHEPGETPGHLTAVQADSRTDS